MGFNLVLSFSTNFDFPVFLGIEPCLGRYKEAF